jgi:hypothetical protein
MASWRRLAAVQDAMREHTVPLTADAPDPSADADERVTRTPHRPGALETLSTYIPDCLPPIGDAGLPLHIPYLTVHLLNDTHDTSPDIDKQTKNTAPQPPNPAPTPNDT